jgi:hypothetical protein
MEPEKKKRIDEIQNAKKVIKELNSEVTREDIVRDNKVEFSLGNDIYRVRMPNNKEKSCADRYKHKQYVALLKDGDYVTRSTLVDMLKENGTDVEDIDEKIIVLNDQVNQFYERIHKTPNENQEQLDSLEKKIEERFLKIQKLSIEKAELLAFCIEEELYTRYLEHLIIICTETLTEKSGEEEATWETVWQTQEEFDNDTNTELAERSTLYLSRLFSMMRRF